MTLKTLGTDKKPQAKKKKFPAKRALFQRGSSHTHRLSVEMKALYGLFCGEGKPWKHKTFFASLWTEEIQRKRNPTQREREQCLERQFTHAHRGLMLR